MIDLHESLSEFSYSYGLTRETEKLLNDIGIRTAPFLSSLLQEAQLGFDVGFDKSGSLLLLQFKLGQSVERFRRSKGSKSSDPLPNLERPFWRFWVNTAEANGQYETLLKAEQDGAETYYSAPRFSMWPDYLVAFEKGEVLERSMLLRPSEIRHALDAQQAADGRHRIAYDTEHVYVCSEPVLLEETPVASLLNRIEERVSVSPEDLGTIVTRVFKGLGTVFINP